MIIPNLSQAIAYGGDYNPEQWPESVWAEDVALMRQAGVNFVSVAIFSWAKLQPSPERFDFGWLDRILDLLHANGIRVCLATATASPPAWLTRLHPSILPVTAEGVTLHPGSRQQFSPSSAAYRDAAAILVQALAERYASHPALAVWHVNNEYACHMNECHGEESQAAFRLWLQRKYQTLDALNHAWGTAFWSQLFFDWEEIFTPRKAPYFSNPTQQLDFKRFTSDAFLELYLMEKRILNAASPAIPVTTNFMGFFCPLDYQRWAREIDFSALDSYPDPVDEAAGRRAHAAAADLTRSLKPGLPFVLMEQATSAVNWRDTNLPKRPGLMRLWSLQTLARGADGIMFFQWRASVAGTEKYHSAIVQHVGHAHSRVFRETAALGAELQRLAPIAGSTVEAEVAIVFDWNCWWALNVDSRPGRIAYAEWAQTIHAWFYERNIAVDFVPPDAPLSGYKAVVAPALYLLSAENARSLETYVAGGGTLLATYFSGIADENDHAQLGGYPAHLRQTLGLWVEEWCTYPKDRGNTLLFAANGATHRCDHWCDLLHLEGATALASFGQDFFQGRPAFTRHSFGQGHAYYLATRPDASGLDAVLAEVCLRQASVKPALATPPGIEATLRRQGDQRFLFLLNHTDTPATIDLAQNSGTDLLTNLPHHSSLTLPPLAVSILALTPP